MVNCREIRFKRMIKMAAAVDTLSSEDDDQILDAIGSWLEGVKPQVRELEQGDIYPEEIVKQMKELGLFSLMYISNADIINGLVLEVVDTPGTICDLSF